MCLKFLLLENITITNLCMPPKILNPVKLKIKQNKNIRILFNKNLALNYIKIYNLKLKKLQSH